MSIAAIATVFLAIFVVESSSQNSTCSEDDYAVWGPLLEEWTVDNHHRETRVLRLTNDRTITVNEDKEGKIAPGKIVNKKPLATSGQSTTSGRQVTETDLYLLNAIEKLVYRVDFMEKRLRKLEEMLYYVMAGNRMDQDPCPQEFTRVGATCYSFRGEAGRELDWKAASKTCAKLGAHLAEMETIEENQDVVAHIQTNQYLRGKDFWTGGLNPGLLWIWSNSARPVPTRKGNKPEGIVGDGRCLRLAYDPRVKSYNYRGSDCGARYSFVCEMAERKSSNEIDRLRRRANV